MFESFSFTKSGTPVEVKLLQHPVPSVAEQDEGLLVGMSVCIRVRILIHIYVYMYMHVWLSAYVYAYTHPPRLGLLVDPQPPQSI